MKSQYGLSDLHGKLVKKADDGPVKASGMEDAEGVAFVCPKCLRDFGSVVQSHVINTWFGDRDVSGTMLSDVTISGSFSAQPCQWRGHVENGAVVSTNG